MLKKHEKKQVIPEVRAANVSKEIIFLRSRLSRVHKKQSMHYTKRQLSYKTLRYLKDNNEPCILCRNPILQN